MRNHSNENKFDLHENDAGSGTHFHLNGLALRLVLVAKGTRECPFWTKPDGKNHNLFFNCLIFYSSKYLLIFIC